MSFELNKNMMTTMKKVGGDTTGKAAERILNKNVYNVHSLSDAIKDSIQSTTLVQMDCHRNRRF